MKRKRKLTLSFFIMLTAAVLISVITFHAFSSNKKEKDTAQNSTVIFTTPVIVTENNNSPETQHKVSLDDALFIGDSRTVGLCEFADTDKANFFSNVGMSVYNIQNKEVYVNSVGNVMLGDLLEQKNYGKIYIMLGINELGYHFGTTLEKYRTLIGFIKSKQPQALLFIEGNLHVTKQRSDSDKIVNNENIERFNSEIKKLADNREIFYIDANSLFDEKSGNLSPKYASDSTHLKVSSYKLWSEWIKQQTALIIGE